ncbi:hypothetical protein FXO37_04382 [Capsicum annuum]|nr:hypothetical protein FXO37_04382 [Capsicum annuum]
MAHRWHNTLKGPPRNMCAYLLDDDMYDHEEEGEDNDDVLKYLKIRTHHASAKDGIDPQVVVDDLESSEICVICHSEKKHKKSIGTLQCRHGKDALAQQKSTYSVAVTSLYSVCAGPAPDLRL